MFRICFVSNSAWSIYNFRIDVIRYFISKGYEVLVFAADDEYTPLLQQEGCIFIPVNFNNRTENPFSDYALYRCLKKLYKIHRPNVVFHYVIKPNIYGSLAAATQGIPSVAVITGMGYGFSKRNWLYLLIKFLYTHALKKTTEIWFLNNDDAKFFIEQHIVKVEKTRVLHGEGINLTHFLPAADLSGRQKFRFLMSTRLLKSKGVAIYADAARILKKKNYDVDFELIGFYEKYHPDSIHHEDMDRWQKEGLIQYRGFAGDVRGFLSAADCFIFPSFYNEGVPRCLMEAASMELPVITSNNRGCKEVVTDNVTGYLCNMNNPFDLADKMEKMLQLPAEERKAMGKKGRQLVAKNFNVDKIITEYQQAIDRIQDRRQET
ncbi:MAG: glycosyltransferase family 4 protein [Chitinophagaceae bacterium]